jgi:hypothetical protein
VSDTMQYAFVRGLFIGIFTPVFKYGFGWMGVEIHWLVAALLAAILVLGGWMIICWMDGS